MPERELNYYRSKLDSLSGDLLQMEYKFASLNNELIQLKNGFKLLIAISTEFYKVPTIKNLEIICNDNVVKLLSMDYSVILKRQDHKHFKISAVNGKYESKLLPEQNVETDRILAWFEDKITIINNSKLPNSATSEDIFNLTGFTFYVATKIYVNQNPEFIILAGRENENKQMRNAPISNADQYIFESLATLFSSLADKLDFDEKMEDERNRIARDMHDNLGSEISGISLTSDLLLFDPKISEQTKLKLTKIKKSSQEIVEHIGNTIWMLNSGNNSLADMVTYMRSYAGQLAEDKGLNILLNDNGIDSKMIISQEKRHHLFMVFKESLNNINKYAKATEIKVDINCNSDEFFLSINDNGIGFEKERQFGNGLKNIRKRIQDCNGTVHIESASGKGTQIQIRIPTNEISH